VPKFVKRFADLRGEIARAVGEYVSEVEAGSFPGPEHSYGMGTTTAPKAAEEAVGDGTLYGAAKPAGTTQA
jgi:hypothetical protein